MRSIRICSTLVHSSALPALVTLTLLFAAMPQLAADPVPVRRSQGTLHGFVLLKDQANRTLAVGDIVQVAHGTRVTARLTYHFRDGSLDDETAVFTQNKTFQLISDHHIQRGPTFPKPIDVSLDVPSGNVTTILSKDGKPETRQDHYDLPSDLANGITSLILFNLDPAAPETRVSMLLPADKPRLAHLRIRADGDDPISIGGLRRSAKRFVIKVELGGVAGVVAPIVGKQPADTRIWILPGEVPAFVRQEGQFFEGGPIWHVEQIGPTLATQAP